MKNSHLVRCPHSSVLTISISKFLKLPVFAAIALGGIQTSMAAQDINIGAGEILSPGLPGGGSGLVIETGTLTIAPTGRLNIQDNAVIVRTDNYAKIYGYLVTGYNFGAWDGFGISSSTAANDLQHLSGVGIIDNSEAHLPTFEGRSTPTNLEILIKFAAYGDANLDGFVNNLDVALMGSGTGIGWYHGDFNYDGVVNAVDYALLNAALPEQLPEPGSMCLLLAGAAIVGSRRTRRA